MILLFKYVIHDLSKLHIHVCLNLLKGLNIGEWIIVLMHRDMFANTFGAKQLYTIQAQMPDELLIMNTAVIRCYLSIKRGSKGSLDIAGW